jgi:hypothetical protein
MTDHDGTVKRRFETHFLSPSEGAKATFPGLKRHHRERLPDGDLAGGAKLLFGLAFPSRYTWTFQAAGESGSVSSFGRPQRGTPDLRKR